MGRRRPTDHRKGDELKLRVSAAEKSAMRAAARAAAANFERQHPELAGRRPKLNDRFLSEWARGVLLEAARATSGGAPPDSHGSHRRVADASEADRAAAWEALKALANAGWRSERPYGDRDELHDR